MKVLEMHNYIRLELNKINSSLYSDMLDEEIDAALNKQQEILMNNCYDGDSPNALKVGFEMNQKRKDDLRKCVVFNQENFWFVDSDGIYKTPLPSNYRYYASSASRIYHSNCKTITSTETTLSKYVAFIKFNPKDIADFSDFDIQTIAASDLSILTRDEFENYSNPDDSEHFIDHLLSSVATGYQNVYAIYWEVFDGKFYENTLIVQRLSGSQSIKYTFNGTDYITKSFELVTDKYKTGATNGGIIKVPNIETQHDDINIMIVDPFNKPCADEPLITLDGQFLRLHTDGVFIPEKIFLTYIRNPKKICLKLQQDCEIASHQHPELVSMTTAYLRSINEGNYQSAENERLKAK